MRDLHTNIHRHRQTHAHRHMRTYVHTDTHTQRHTRTHTIHRHRHTNKQTHTYTDTDDTHTHTYTHTHTQTHTHNIHTHTHTHTHTHILYTHIQSIYTHREHIHIRDYMHIWYLKEQTVLTSIRITLFGHFVTRSTDLYKLLYISFWSLLQTQTTIMAQQEHQEFIIIISCNEHLRVLIINSLEESELGPH